MPETPQHVKDLIQKAYDEKATFLDLGRCGLTEIPEEIEMLSAYLETVNFGWYYQCHKEYISSKNTGPENNFTSASFLIFKSFSNFKSLYLYSNQIADKGVEAIAQLSSLTSLGVRGNQISDKGAEAIARLSNLAYLNISENQISDKGAAAIARLSNLVNLDISSNQITGKGAEAIAQLSNLINLDVSFNKITDKGAEAIARLSNLTTLYVSFNKITGKGAEAIARLSNLTTLYVNDNQITGIGAEAIARLGNLTTLDINNNQIADKGAEAIARLSNLTTLYITGNQITDKGAEAIARLSNLTTLSIIGNRITDKGAEAIAQLSNLTTLSIIANRITDKGAEAIARLSNLTTLNVSGNKITELQTIRLLIDKLENLSYISFDSEKIKGLPREISRNIQALRGYFASTQKTPNTLVKMILIGNTTAGKSSLADFLINKMYDAERKSTHGIQRWRWKTAEGENALQVNIWDFGGQDYYHATHNLFLENKSIFVLLHTSKDIHNKNAPEQQWLPVNYWLGNVRDIAGTDCPVWLVASKADAGETEQPGPDLQKIYNVAAEYKISVKQAYDDDKRAMRKFDDFSQDLIDELDKLKGAELPASWVKIRDVYLPKWRTENTLYLTEDAFKTQCENALANDAILLQDLKASWDGLLLYLKGCGEVIYFDDNAAISDIIFLSAEQLTKDIYETILTEDVLKNGGVIDTGKIEAANGALIQIYIEVLQTFKLIFKKPGSENLYVAPQYLPENPYEEMIKENIPLAYAIHFSDYMSRSLITKFIVGYASNVPEKNRWRYGAYFEKYGLKTFVKINAEEQKIYVHIQEGKKEYRQQLMKELFLFFTKTAPRKEKEDDAMFSRKEELIKANTELSTNDKQYVRVQEIKLAIQSQVQEVKSAQGEYVKLDAVLTSLINENTMIPKKIFLSYSHKDEAYKKELDTHFAALKRSNKVGVWQDREIKAGDDWNKAIEDALLNADIALFLLSPDFMASGYIWDVEIPKAIKRGVTVVPVFLRPCDFREDVFNLYKLQGLPADAKWIISSRFPYPDEAYLEVVEGVKKLL